MTIDIESIEARLKYRATERAKLLTREFVQEALGKVPGYVERRRAIEVGNAAPMTKAEYREFARAASEIAFPSPGSRFVGSPK